MGLLRTSVYVLLLALLYQMGRSYWRTRLPVHHDGVAAPGWEPVIELFKQQVEEGSELGGMFSVYHDGEPVVTVWGGYADDAARVPWERDTLSIYCSTTKAITAIVLEILADRGYIDYSAPVVKYWSQFGQQGKKQVTVAQLVSHQAGLFITDKTISFFDIVNNPEMISKLFEAQKPAWPPGEAFGYHAVTMAMLVDELVRRVDPQHRTLSNFFHDEVAVPFEVDFHIGLPRSEHYRVAHVYPAEVLTWESIKAMYEARQMYMSGFQSDSRFSQLMRNPIEMLYLGDAMNGPYFREIPLGSLNGYGTGESAAKIMGILAAGGATDGQTLLSTEAIKHLGTPLVNGTDAVTLLPRVYGPGTNIRKADHGGLVFGHEGFGHQMAYADPEKRLGWSYLTNHFSPKLWGTKNYLALLEAMYECAGS